MDFYLVLREIMDEQDLTVKQVSEATGISLQTLKSILHRKHKNIMLDQAMRLHKGLNISFERLNGEPDAKKPPIHPRRQKEEPDLKILFDTYTNLNETGKEKVLTYAKDIHTIKKYRKDDAVDENDAKK